MEDSILVNVLELRVRLGVPEGERAEVQRVTVSMRIVPERGLVGLGDDVGNTVDYAAVCEVVKAEGEGRPRRLVETLAEDIAEVVLTRFPVRSVEVEVRKYVVEGTGWVGVRIGRRKG